MRVYIHREQLLEVEAFELADDQPIGASLGVDGTADVVLLEDADEALDLTSTPAAAGIADRAHLFRGRPRRVDVEIVMNDAHHTRTFAPSARVKRVFRWAVDVFGLGKADAAEHELALPDGSAPPGDTHIGSLDDETPGHLRLSLVPKHRFEG